MGKQGDSAAATAGVERWRRHQHGNGGGSGAAALDARWQCWQSGGGCAAAERRRWAVLRWHWQRKGGRGSAAAALDAVAAAWRWRAAGRQGGVSGGNRVVVAAAARCRRWHGGRGGGGSSPITPATALPIPLLIAAARLGNVAVSLCGMRGGSRLWGGFVTPVCHIPVNRVDKVVRFAGILRKKFKTLIINNRTPIIYNLNFKYLPEPIIYNWELYIMKPQGSSINKPGSKYSPGPIIYNRSLFKTGATDLHPYSHYRFSKISRPFCANRNW